MLGQTKTDTMIKSRRTSYTEIDAISNTIAQKRAGGAASKRCSTQEKRNCPSAILIMGKKDGSYRLCVDSRTLNKTTKPTAYPFSLIDEILYLIGKATCFTRSILEPVTPKWFLIKRPLKRVR